jgi:hypothetical protein
MKIYKVYVYSTASENYFKTRKSANAYIKEFYEEHLSYFKNYGGTLKDFIDEEGIEITRIDLED